MSRWPHQIPPLPSRVKRNLFLIFVGVLGIVLSGHLGPEFSTEPPALPAEPPAKNLNLPLPPIGPREGGINPLDRPFLFQLSSTDKLSGLERERALQTQYQGILATLHGEMPKVEIKDFSGMTVLTIDGQPFATVLPVDAPDYYQRLSPERQHDLEHEIAEHWKHLLEVDLAEETYHRSPQYLAIFPYFAAQLFFLALIGHALADAFSRRVLRSPGWSLKLFVWVLFLSLGASQHPVFKPMALALARSGLLPIFSFLMVFTVCSLLYRVSIIVLDRYVAAYILSKNLVEDEGFAKRTNTLVQGGRFLLGTVTFVGGSIWFLSTVGINVGNLFAGAGIAGIALGVVGKDVLIDYFYGANILLDNHFNIGDHIETPVATGTVESFNLRTTRVREKDGGLSIVTNGRFTVIKNHSRDFAQTDFRVGVAYDTDVDRALGLMQDEVEKLAQEQPNVVTATPLLMGVQELGESAVTLRILVRTAALSQWAVKRELNRRVLQRFRHEGIEIPFPQQDVWLRHTAVTHPNTEAGTEQTHQSPESITE